MADGLEHGRFIPGPCGSLRFAGSASGIYFTDAVRSDISEGGIDHGIEEAFLQRVDHGTDPTYEHKDTQHTYHTLRAEHFKHEREIRERFDRYFSIWHPLFPFLDGARLSQTLDAAANVSRGIAAASNGRLLGETSNEELGLSTIILSVISIGSLGQTADSVDLPVLQSATHGTWLAYTIMDALDNGAINSLLALQALVAVDLYLYAARRSRQAYRLCGSIIKIAFEAGLHRCPGRHPQIFPDAATCELRKRLFYSIYCLERLLSQELGMPVVLSDTDIDVCQPGTAELHQHHQQSTSPATEAYLEDREGESGTNADRPLKRKRDDGVHTPYVRNFAGNLVLPQERNRLSMVGANARLLCAITLIRITYISGQIMEALNKSARYRYKDPSDLLVLRADLDGWWNDIGIDSELDITDVDLELDPRFRYSPLWTCLYQQHVIHLNRHLLALQTNHVGYQQAIQAAVMAARRTSVAIIRSVEIDAGNCFWPGYVDMAFFAALVLIYAHRRKESSSSGSLRIASDLTRCLKILNTAQIRWSKLEPLVDVVKAFIDATNPESTSLSCETSRPDTPANHSVDAANPFQHLFGSNVAGGHEDPFDFMRFLDMQQYASQ